MSRAPAASSTLRMVLGATPYRRVSAFNDPDDDDGAAGVPVAV
jgi:hypothetical protein